MIFVLATDDWGLEVFPTKEEAIAACEGIDVEEGNYLFWDNDGSSLEARFSTPNKHGSFTVVSGVYDLLPEDNGDPLVSVLSKAKYLEANSWFSSVEAVRRHLTST